jgi:hypothetical protein
MIVWVAYNSWGDLVATADSYDRLVRSVERMGWSVLDLWIGQVRP